MKILYILLGYLVNYVNSQCDQLKMQPIVNCYSYIQKCYILEGDKENYQELQHINTQIVRKSFKIPYQVEPILIRIINSLTVKKLQEKLMCSLFLNHIYYITCINFDLILYQEQTSYSEFIRIDTSILADEVCDEMFTNEDGSLMLFCIGQSTLKQYSLNLLMKVTLTLEYDVSEQILDKCNKKQMKQKENQYLIVFYQCSKWKVLLIKNNKVKTISEAKMKYQQIVLQQFSIVDDVFICEYNDIASALYLIENDFYVQVFLNQQVNTTPHYFFFKHTNRIQKVVIQQPCQIISLVEKSNLLNSKSSKVLEVILNQQYQNNNIHFHSNILFLQNQFELNVVINAQINQTYQISNTSLHFIDFNNLFCQYDQSKKVLQFYNYYPLPVLIKPKSKYIFVIQRNDLFKRNAIIKCFRIVDENKTQKQISDLVQQVTFKNNCQNMSQLLQKSENSNYFQNRIYNLNTSQGNNKLSIRKYTDFQNHCLQRLYQFQIQGRFELRNIIDDYICFQNETFFYIYNCKQNKFSNQVNKDQYNVLESKGAYYFWKKNNTNVLRGVYFQAESLLQFNLKFDEMIINVKQISQSVFLYMNNSNLPLIIMRNSEYNPYKNYLSRSLYQPEPILSYFEFGNSKFIQYIKILAFQNKENLRCFQFPESIIISITALTLKVDCYFIVAIESLILHYFNDNALHQIQNFTFQDYSFYYPFKYSIDFENIVILIEQNKSLNLAIFYYNFSFLQLDEIIETDDTFFQIYIKYLLFCFNKIWRYQFLNHILMELETDVPYQNTLSSNFSLVLNEQSDFQLRVSIQNQCFKLYSLIKSSIIEIQKNCNLRLNTSEIFYGPIRDLKLINNSNIILKGPFQYKKEPQICNYEISSFCIKQYQFETQLTTIKFSVILLENYIFKAIKTNSDNNNVYLTWIKQQYYLCVSSFQGILNIQLIECSENYNENCKIISNLNDNFKIRSIDMTDTMRIGNLIKLKSDFNLTFICIEDINFNVQMLPGIIIDILYIEQSNDQYLILQKNIIDSNDLELIIYSINLNQKHLVYSLTITNELQLELTRNGNFYNSKCTVKLVSCKYFGELINIKLFIMDLYFSQYLSFNLNQQKNQVQLEMQKHIRNDIFFESTGINNFIIEYIDDNILVLKSTLNNISQFYDIQEDRTFYDYFHKSMFSMKINRVNTTHFIFFNNFLIYLGSIGYELELLDWDQIEQNFELFAQNEISNEKVSLQIHINYSNQQFSKNIILIEILCFIFIFIYIRKMKYRNRQKNAL